jgi:hypothetical protein
VHPIHLLTVYAGLGGYLRLCCQDLGVGCALVVSGIQHRLALSAGEVGVYEQAKICDLFR